MDGFDEEEVFVDCGAYDGDTVIRFSEFMSSRYKNIYAFEPDRINLEKMKDRIASLGLKNITVIEGAVTENTGSVDFWKTGGLGSAISDKESNPHCISVDAYSLDSTINGSVSFIKMDIEGGELAALKGAARIINEYHPKLAICLYHRWDDFFEIPMYIKNNFPEYQITIRHHVRGFLHDFVMYASAKKKEV